VGSFASDGSGSRGMHRLGGAPVTTNSWGDGVNDVGPSTLVECPGSSVRVHTTQPVPDTHGKPLASSTETVALVSLKTSNEPG